MHKVTLRTKLGNLLIENASIWNQDNLSIALAYYFENHCERPDDDDDDEETGWSPWVMQKTNEALDLIAEQLGLSAFVAPLILSDGKEKGATQ